MFGFGTRAGTGSAKFALETRDGSMFGFGTRRKSSTMAELGVRPSPGIIGFCTRVSIMLRFGTRLGTLGARRSSTGGAIIGCSLMVSLIGSLKESLIGSLIGSLMVSLTGSLIGSRCII